MGRIVSVAEVAFEEAWRGVAAQVSARCRQLSRDSHEAEELYQLTAIRAWRGQAGFRGESAYLTWVMRILDREAARLAERRIRKTTREITLDPLAANESRIDQFGAHSHTGGGGVHGRSEIGVDAGADGGAETGWLRPLLDDAVTAGAISDAEHRIVAERLAKPDESWVDIAARLGMTATACAVAHSRTVPKLRVFLFTDRGALIGGTQAIADAFDRIRGDPAAALTDLEAEAFEHLVIRHSPGYRRRGSQAALRGACAKVARRMGLP
jgi:RNA polymerase sigma-70 factor (ECF subfamily)